MSWNRFDDEDTPIPNDTLLDVIKEDGEQLQLFFSNSLLSIPDGSMYVYYVPEFWKPAVANSNPTENKKVVSDLLDTLGGKLVAYLGEVHQTLTVDKGEKGELEIPESLLPRLNYALKATKIIMKYDSALVAQVWFQGRNPHLRDEAPAWVLRYKPLKTHGPLVLEAARSHISM